MSLYFIYSNGNYNLKLKQNEKCVRIPNTYMHTIFLFVYWYANVAKYGNSVLTYPSNFIITLFTFGTQTLLLGGTLTLWCQIRGNGMG
jgi:hypothetical protein